MTNLLKLAADWANQYIERTSRQSINLAPQAAPSQGLSDAEIQSILGEWSILVERYKNGDLRSKVAGVEKNFIEPYIIQTRQLGHNINSLISTIEAQCWWDLVAYYSDLVLIDRFNMIRPGDTVFDLGASHGFYSVLFSKLAGPTGHVYAFEPFALNADYIRFNSRLNRSNIDVYEVGLSNQTAEVRVRLDTQCVGDRDEHAALVPIQLDMLDNYAHLKPDFIKIDIEGAEIDTLEAASKIFETRPALHVEIHYDYYHRFGRKLEDLFDVLPMKDYVVYIDHPGRPIQPFHRDYEITNYCALYFLKEEPIRRIEVPHAKTTILPVTESLEPAAIAT